MLLLAALLAVGCAPEAPRKRAPNIVLIVVDTLRADRLGAYGSRRPLTPFLDELASRSTVFHRAYAQSSWTVPSVASLLTSRFPSQHRALGWLSPLKIENRTLAEVLHAHGYDTGGWSANTMIEPPRGFARGFDYFKVGQPTTMRGMGDIIFSARAGGLHEDAMYWVARNGKDAPSPDPGFLYFQFMEAHYPYAPPPELLWRLSPGHFINVKKANDISTLMPGGFPLADLENLYDAEVADLDATLKILFRDLTDLHFLEDTIVVVTSDHGEEFEDHAGRGHGETLYDELIRIPLIVHLPGQTERRDVDRVVSLIDVAPTLLDLAGIPPPRTFEGHSFRDAVSRGPWDAITSALARPAPERPAFSELLPKGKNDPLRHDRAIVDGGLKLLVSPAGDTERFDLIADPGEHAPLEGAAHRGELAAILARLTERARGVKLEETDDASEPEIDEKARQRLKALGYAG
jgi:arylsulfatase A-like enzyme